MKAFKSAALSTLLIAGSFAYQKTARAYDFRLPQLLNTYVVNLFYYDQAYDNALVGAGSLGPVAQYAFNLITVANEIFYILEDYTQAVSQNRSSCSEALDNYTYLLNNGANTQFISQIGIFANEPRFVEQRRLTTNYCSN